MDSMIQRDTMQKMAFLNDLTTFWDKFDDRILRLKVTTLGLCPVTIFSKALLLFDYCLLVKCPLCALSLHLDVCTAMLVCTPCS